MTFVTQDTQIVSHVHQHNVYLVILDSLFKMVLVMFVIPDSINVLPVTQLPVLHA